MQIQISYELDRVESTTIVLASGYEGSGGGVGGGDNACGSMMTALRHNGSTTLAILPDCTIFGCNNNVLHLF